MVLVSGRNDTFKPLLREITLKEWRKLQMESMLLQGLASVEQVHIHFSVETSFLAHRCTITFLPWGQKNVVRIELCFRCKCQYSVVLQVLIVGVGRAKKVSRHSQKTK